MPIDQWIKQRIDAESVAVLNRAFECALRELGLVDRADALTAIVATKIIEVGATGISDPKEIARAALKRLGLATAPHSGRKDAPPPD
jgi:hypothetical protein